MIKTLITAHSGAEHTVDNTLESIRVMADSGADIIEVDVRKVEGCLVMSHDEPASGVQCDALADCFAILREHEGLRVNIDLKQEGIMGDVADLAEQCGVVDRLLFTGAVGAADIECAHARNLTVWYNNDAMPADADWIAGVDALGFEALNLHFGDVSEDLRDHAHRLSVWTVNGANMLRRFLEAGVKNITTHEPKLAIQLRDEIQGEPKAERSMKVVTFNIRGDFGIDGDNNFYYRKPLILKKLAEEKPDIVGFQEVMPHVAQWLRDNLTDYYVIGCGRGEKLDDEQETVIFRKDRFNLIEMRTFWLSETPYVPASRYQEQSDCPRVSTEAVLMENTTGKVIRVLNTHLDHIGVGARKLGLRQILNHLKNVSLFPDAPVILMGDFNAWPDGEELTVFDEFPGYTNAAEGIGITYHGYHRTYQPEPIDYIYIKGGLKCERKEKWTDITNGVYLSDHYPVCAEVVLL